MLQAIPLRPDPLHGALWNTGLRYFAPEAKCNGSASGNKRSALTDDNDGSQNCIDSKSLAIALVQQKIANISSQIATYENDINVIRRKLALANQELDSATNELEVLQQPQHAGANIIRDQQHLQQKNGDLSSVFASSFCSQLTSSDGLTFLTPTCSIDEGDGGFYSLQSISTSESSDSLDSLPSFHGDNKYANRSYIDIDETPLRSNKTNSCNEYDSTQTISTATSTHAGQEDGKQLFKRQNSYMRSHDLASFSDASFIPLSEEGPGISAVVDALVEIGLEVAMDECDRWVPERSTAKNLGQRAELLENNRRNLGPMGSWSNAAYGDEVLVWTAECRHDGYGSEYPMVKARGLLPTSAYDMIELLMDSERVKEYNKMSLGRENEHFFSKGVHNTNKNPDTNLCGEAKLVRSRSQPPVIRKPVELRLFLYARKLEPGKDGKGAKYLTIGRSVWENDNGTVNADATEATRCEMLLSVNLIRDIIYRGEKWCEITSVTHGVSPGIPIFIARKAALMAAEKYIKDIRSVFVK